MAISIHSSLQSVPPSNLAPATRVEGIAVLLTKAILLSEAKRAVAAQEATVDEFGNSLDEQILRFLRVSGRGSPAVIRRALGLSKATTYRAILRLTATGAIVSTGQTRALAYILAEREPSPEIIARN